MIVQQTMSRPFFRRRKFRGSRLVLAAMALAVGAALLNWLYQVARKPTELFFPVSGALAKSPAETWREYGALFRRHSTAVMTPELLAALAQVEGSGNPLARTPWRLAPLSAPGEIYRPASSAVGMYQITDGTFREAKRYCIHRHTAIEEGCWFNGLYLRVIPSHAIEMTSAYLDRRVAAALAGRRAGATLEQKQALAALIHLCGAAAGEAYVRRGLRLAGGQRCGEHDPRAYLERVRAAQRVFARLSTLG
jgi:hypothetical protein